MLIRMPPFRVGFDFNEYVCKFRANEAGPAQKNPLGLPKGLKDKVLDS